MTARYRPAARASALVGAIALVALSATAILAQTEGLGGKLRTGETITIGAVETIAGDLYVVAGTVIVDGTVDGDLVVAGGDVQVNGTVSGDLVAAGGTVTVSGSVAGDARVGAGQLTISGQVGEDVAVAAGQATITASGSVGEDVIASAGQLTIAGSVAGSVEGGAGTYQRTGTVGGTENVAIGETAEPEEADATNPVLEALRHWVIVVLLGALALWLFPRLTRSAAELLRLRPLATFGVGLLALLGWVLGVIATIIVIIVAAIVLGLIGFGDLAALIAFAGVLAIAVATFLLIVIVAYLADAVVGLALAGFIRNMPVSRWTDLARLAAGAAVVVIVTSLPYVGGWIKLIVVILGLGALVFAAWRGRRPAEVVAEPQPTTWGA